MRILTTLILAAVAGPALAQTTIDLNVFDDLTREATLDEGENTSGEQSETVGPAEKQEPVTVDQIMAAQYDGGALPDGQSAITVMVQALLDRAAISPGVIDGWKGGMSTSAISAFETREGLAVDGVMDQAVWEALGGPTAGPVLTQYTITDEDTARIGGTLPTDYAEIARMDWIHYTDVAEKLGEDFHMDREFLISLNAGRSFTAGETIYVVRQSEDVAGEVTEIVIDKTASRLIARGADGRIIANYPVAVGSTQTPSPSGVVEVNAIAVEPTYSYNPSLNFQQGDNDKFLTLPPGPNGPVGIVWIDLSKPTYGIHGTPEPASLFSSQSHGCVRMTNWDAMELAHMVSPGTTVRFQE